MCPHIFDDAFASIVFDKCAGSVLPVAVLVVVVVVVSLGVWSVLFVVSDVLRSAANATLYDLV